MCFRKSDCSWFDSSLARFILGVRCSTAGRGSDLFMWFDVRRVLGTRNYFSGVRCSTEKSQELGSNCSIVSVSIAVFQNLKIDAARKAFTKKATMRPSDHASIQSRVRPTDTPSSLTETQNKYCVECRLLNRPRLLASR